MTSFLDKLNGRLGKEENGAAAASPASSGSAKPGEPSAKDHAKGQNAPSVSSDDFSRRGELPIDMYETPSQVVIFIPAAGVDPQSFDLTLDEEKDLLLVRASSAPPEEFIKAPSEGKEEDGRYVEQGCAWGPLFRKIILPGEVDSSRAEAILKKGVLTIRLPLMKAGEGVKLNVKEMLSSPPPDGAENKK